MVVHVLPSIPILFPLNTISKPIRERVKNCQVCFWCVFAISVLEEHSTTSSISYSEIWQKCTSFRPSRALLIYLKLTQVVWRGQVCWVATLDLSLAGSRKQEENIHNNEWVIRRKGKGIKSLLSQVFRIWLERKGCKSDQISLPGITYFALCGPCGGIKGVLVDLGFKQTVRVLSMILISKKSDF